MTTEYSSIQPVAFTLQTGEKLDLTLQTLEFPEAWKQELWRLMLQRGQRAAPAAPTHLPIRTLNRAMRALFPQVLAILPAAHRPGTPWLAARTPLPTWIIYRVVSEWVRATWTNPADPKSRQHVEAALSRMRPADLHWKPVTWTAAAWQTAPPPDDPLYHLLPAVLAEMISDPEVSLDLKGVPLYFRRAQSSPDRPGAELFSWPPLFAAETEKQKKKSRKWYYSILLTLTIQTLPFVSSPLIYAEWGLRRWVSTPLEFLPPGTETSVFVSSTVPWFPELPGSTTFQVVPLRYTRSKLVWGSHLPQILDSLSVNPGSAGNAFIDPKKICDDPAGALHGTNGHHAAIVWRPGLEPVHYVQPGIPVASRRLLTKALAEVLRNQAELVPPMEKRYPGRNLKIAWRQGWKDSPLLHTTNPDPAPLTVEIYTWTEPPQVTSDTPTRNNNRATPPPKHQPEPVTTKEETATSGTAPGNNREEQPRALIEKLCDALPKAGRLMKNCSIQVLPLNELGERLDLAGDAPLRQRLHQGWEQRMQQIRSRVAPTPGPVPAFVELPGAEDFDELSDPKNILRMGLAQAGRLTQFLRPEKHVQKQAAKSNQKPPPMEHRIRQAIQDMLRQLGDLRVFPEHHRLTAGTLTVAGLWVLRPLRLRGWRHLPPEPVPVMVRVKTENWQTEFWKPGMPDWVPYPRGLLTLAREAAQPAPSRTDTISAPRLREIIREQFGSGNEDVLLIVHAQNARKMWPWLENHKLTRDAMAADNECPWRADQLGKLRVVRIRDSQGAETPEWFAPAGTTTDGQHAPRPAQQHNLVIMEAMEAPGRKRKAETGFSGGLFSPRGSDRLFFSAFPPPPQAAGIPRDAPLEMQSWNPSLVEIVPVVLQPGDHPVEWAAYVHELRRALPHYTEAAVLPLPLHLAALAAEYVMPVNWQTVLEEEEEG